MPASTRRCLDAAFTSHVLRHTFGATLVRVGHDLVLVAERAGRRRLETARGDHPPRPGRSRTRHRLATDGPLSAAGSSATGDPFARPRRISAVPPRWRTGTAVSGRSSSSAISAPLSASLSSTAPRRSAASRYEGSASTVRTAAAISAGRAVRGSVTPAPRWTTRAALSAWSRPCGMTTTGTPAAKDRTRVPCPPWVTTSAASRSTAACEAAATTVAFAGARRADGSTAGPVVTTARTGRSASASTTRCRLLICPWNVVDMATRTTGARYAPPAGRPRPRRGRRGRAPRSAPGRQIGREVERRTGEQQVPPRPPRLVLVVDDRLEAVTDPYVVETRDRGPVPEPLGKSADDAVPQPAEYTAGRPQPQPEGRQAAGWERVDVRHQHVERGAGSLAPPWRRRRRRTSARDPASRRRWPR